MGYFVKGLAFFVALSACGVTIIRGAADLAKVKDYIATFERGVVAAKHTQSGY